MTLLASKQPFLAEMHYSRVVWAKEMLKLLTWFQHRSDTVVLVLFPGTVELTSARALHLAPARGMSLVKRDTHRQAGVSGTDHLAAVTE